MAHTRSVDHVEITGDSRAGDAPSHQPLANGFVHVFVDDQNLFIGLSDAYGRSYDIDFGKLLTEASRTASGNLRPVRTAFVAGIIPDDDDFWHAVERQGFTVRRGFINEHDRSKQDDAYVVSAITAALYEEEGPSTIVLVAGDADYVPPLERAVAKGWRVEVAFTFPRSISIELLPVAHEFRRLDPRKIRAVKDHPKNSRV